MRHYRRIEISVERTRVFDANRCETTSTDWCERCGEPVQMVTLGEALAIKGMSSRTIHRLIEADELHFAETENGSIRVCLTSLLNQKSESEIPLQQTSKEKSYETTEYD